MTVYKNFKKKNKGDTANSCDSRLRVGVLFLSLFTFVIVIRLFVLMVVEHGFYVALAAGSQSLYEQLFPERGEIFFMADKYTGEAYPAALNKDFFIVFVDTREIKDDNTAEDVSIALSEVFQYDDQKKLEVYLQVNKRTDPYEPIENKVEENLVDILKERNLPGVGFVRRSERFYPEGELGAHVIGFVGRDENGNDIGRYGIEGYWQQELGGKGGFLEAKKGLAGSLIPLAGRSFEAADDGADIYLTIDRTLQFKACERLRQGMEEYGAASASLIIMDPSTGAIRAMCSLPDFDLNDYGNIDDVNAYNNSSIFTAYEPGSIFKPIAMAAALDLGILTQDSYFYDSGSKEGLCRTPIKNAMDKAYKDQTMTGVLVNSINTGMIYVVEQIGKKNFIDYIEKFGFGVKTGIELDSESSGTIQSLFENKVDQFDCYAATASFGQGITATPLQMVSAFGAIANGGNMMKTYVVEKIVYSDGKIAQTRPKSLGEIISKKSAAILSAMLVKVVDSGHAGASSVKGYYVAGKTGTAQIANKGGYSDETNQSFVGFAPVDDPKFVMIIKFDRPQRNYSDSTTAPVFGDISKFLLDYYQVPPSR